MSYNAEKIERPTSERLHNYNCYAYLKALTILPVVIENIQKISPLLAISLLSMPIKTYDTKFAYADLYTQFFTVVEENIQDIFDEPRRKLLEEQPPNEQEIAQLDAFILSIYDNNNGILEHTFDAIQHIPLQHRPIDDDIEKKISSFIKDEGDHINRLTQTPAQVGSAYGRFTAMMADNFKPQHTTSLSTVRTYSFNENSSSPKELRFGTQAQRDHGMERVSPLFERWLDIQERKHPSSDVLSPTITHLYVNNLGLDRTDAEGKKERALTHVLHFLEERHNNVAVITLPADKGLMHESEFKKTTDAHDYQEVRDDFLNIANQNPDAKRDVKDVYISDKVRRLLFKDETGFYSNETEVAHLQHLLDKSFKAHGIEGGALTSAQRQAVWFHFIKFELPNHFIKTLKPNSMNFSCKDAIDRGGVSSAYYNLMKSIEQNNPMSRAEFDRALHAAPTMVKARGMNHHLKLIWNAVDSYINANYEEVKKDSKQAWLVEWRDSNCPHARAEALLKLRIQQTKDELTQTKSDCSSRADAIKKGLDILELVQQQSISGVSGKRLLLEVVTRTPDVIFNPSNQSNTSRYHELSDKLAIKYPRLQILVGLMKYLLAAVLYLPTFGRTESWKSQGAATAQAGFKATTRQELQQHIKDQVINIKKEEHSAELISDEKLSPPKS